MKHKIETGRQWAYMEAMTKQIKFLSRQLLLMLFLCGFVFLTPAQALTGSSQILIDSQYVLDDDTSSDSDVTLPACAGDRFCRNGSAIRVQFDLRIWLPGSGMAFNQYATGPPARSLPRSA